ncbi:helix-turn-helix domain-containing protein [Streptosporangium sandarakinum]|uniref:helix-turn-helix domain-containing protein n=1 Tax=Streptosporangium sandarakinum TaxID=1260955 RepID=UPI00371EE3DB
MLVDMRGTVASTVDSSPIGWRIRKMRQQLGWTQERLAAPELSESYVSLIEAGKRTPTPAVLDLLAEKLGCALSYLTEGVTPEQIQEVELDLAAARMALDDGRAVEACDRYRRLLDSPALADLPRYQPAAGYGLALALEARGDLVGAISILVRMVPPGIWSQLEEHDVDTAVALARCYLRHGDLRQAAQLAEGILASSTAEGWNERLVELGATLLTVYADRGDLLRARQWADELQQSARSVGTAHAMTVSWWAQAVAAVQDGRGEEAVACTEQALAACPERAEPKLRVRAVLMHAEVVLAVRPEEAERCRAQLLALQVELRGASHLERVECAYHLAHAELLCGRPEVAAHHLEDVLSRIEVAPRSLQLHSRLLAGQVMAALGKTKDAAGEVASARAFLVHEPPTRRTVRGWLTLAQVLEQLGDADGSIDAYKRVMDIVEL